jgi:hypothetical protein
MFHVNTNVSISNLNVRCCVSKFSLEIASYDCSLSKIASSDCRLSIEISSFDLCLRQNLSRTYAWYVFRIIVVAEVGLTYDANVGPYSQPPSRYVAAIVCVVQKTRGIHDGSPLESEAQGRCLQPGQQ